MTNPGEISIRELDREEIDEILARNNVGRLAYARGNHIDIQPVHYVHADGWLYGRTSYGSKLKTLGTTAYRWWPVVFQVDEVEDLFHWHSVVVRGGFYVLSKEGSEEEQAAWETGLELMRELVPTALREGDPTPMRTVLFRISVQEVTGRASQPAAEEAR